MRYRKINIPKDIDFWLRSRIKEATNLNLGFGYCDSSCLSLNMDNWDFVILIYTTRAFDANYEYIFAEMKDKPTIFYPLTNKIYLHFTKPPTNITITKLLPSLTPTDLKQLQHYCERCQLVTTPTTCKYCNNTPIVPLKGIPANHDYAQFKSLVSFLDKHIQSGQVISVLRYVRKNTPIKKIKAQTIKYPIDDPKRRWFFYKIILCPQFVFDNILYYLDDAEKIYHLNI